MAGENFNKNSDERVTYFAFTDARGKRIPFGIKAKDRTRHVYVIGKTGMGKSTLLENLAIQDIQNGEGLAFIDPHGGTAEKLLDYVPEHRIDDVLYFAPFDTENPVAFNVMEDVGPARRHFVASGLMSAFKKIWVDAWSARMEYILSNTLLALLEYPGSTLLGVNRMLSDKIFRERVVANISDPSVKSFWTTEFAKYTERFAAEATPAIQNKVGQYTSNPLIRNIIGQPKSSFDLREMMDKKKIIIMNLSKGLVGETNTSLLGSMLTTRLYLAALSRADATAAELSRLPNFYFFVDEFQSFANESFADILAEARKYKLNLTIAHQYVDQMEETVRNAVFGNVGTTVAFRVGPLDGELLEKIFSPKFMATDLVNLGLRQVYLTLMIDGVGSEPFSATTLPPIERPARSFREEILAASRKKFGRPKAQVEKDIHTWHVEMEEAMATADRASRDAQRAKSRERTNAQGTAQSTSRPPRQSFGPRDGEPRPRGGHQEFTPIRETPVVNRPSPPGGMSLKDALTKAVQERPVRHVPEPAVEEIQEAPPAALKRPKGPSPENRSALRDALQGAIGTNPAEAPRPEARAPEVKAGPKEIPEDELRNMLRVEE